ncbi:MAG: S1 RNA-binding domain-containing protein [Patescibacteria group bacterium]
MTQTKESVSSEIKNEELDELIKNSTAIKNLPKVGDLVEGEVLDISPNAVLIDINHVTIGVIRGYELYDESGESAGLKVGDKITATVLEMENENGEMELSFRFAGHEKAWDILEALKKSQETVEVTVVNANKGGLMIKLNRISGFLPVSQLSQEHYPRVDGGAKAKILEKLKKLADTKLKVKVLDVSQEENKLIVSEKETMKEQVKEALGNYKVGDIVDGVVSGVVDFGAFIKFDDGLEGLVHLSELAWKRIDDPRNVIAVGDKIKAKIISIDGSKVSFSIKQLKDDPWKEASEKYTVGQKVEGTVLKVNPFGLFVELDKKIHGLCHISEISQPLAGNLSNEVKEGSKMEFKILSIEPTEHRLGLSIKALKEPKAEKVEGEVTEEVKEEKKATKTKKEAKEEIAEEKVATEEEPKAEEKIEE